MDKLSPGLQTQSPQRVSKNIRIAPDLKRWVQLHAVENGISDSDVIELALLQFKQSIEASAAEVPQAA